MSQANQFPLGRRFAAIALMMVVMAATTMSLSSCRLFNQGTVSQAPARGAGY